MNSAPVRHWVSSLPMALLTAALLNPAAARAQLTITTVVFPPATTGVPYAVTLSATGGTTPYMWSVSSGMLPSGLTLHPTTGGISGTPTGPNVSGETSSSGTFYPFPLIFQVQDALGATATANLPIEVADPIVIQTTSLPPGSVGVAYSLCLAATGGALAYNGGTWSVTGGALPPGLDLTSGQGCRGLLAGTPALAGPYPVQLQVGDFQGRVAKASYILTITGGSSTALTLMLTPPSLSFTGVAGGGAPPSQTSVVALSSGAMGISATVTKGASWLSVSPAASTTPATLTVSVDPTTLSPGPANGTIEIVAPGASNSPQYLGVTLTVVEPTPAISSVSSAASLAAGAAAPGSIVTIKGTALGPATGVSMQPDSKGNYATILDGVQVLFNGIAGPMLYAQSGQINAIVPFEIAGASSIGVQVANSGMTSGAFSVPLQQAVPALFTASGSGTGQGAILNQDSTVNSSANPAAAGTTVALFGTGGGPFQTALDDGTTAGVTNLELPVTAQIGGTNAQVMYAGSAPGLVAGGFQINVTIPAGTPSGNVPVVVFVNGVASQSPVTVAVK